jgi:PDZ domain-containing protein
VRARGGRQGGHRGRDDSGQLIELPEGVTGCLDHSGCCVGEGCYEGAGEAGPPQTPGEVARPPADLGRGVGQAGGEILVTDRTGPRQGTERCGADGGNGVALGRSGRGFIAPVAGYGRSTPGSTGARLVSSHCYFRQRFTSRSHRPAAWNWQRGTLACVSPMTTDWTVPGPRAATTERARRGPSAAVAALVAALVAIGVLVALSFHFAGQYFVFSPGTAPVITTSRLCEVRQGQLELPRGTPCVRLRVPAAKAHSLDGRLLMVDVEVSQASPLQWAEYELGLLGKQRQLVSVASYAGGSPTSELGCQDAQQMTSSNEDATLAALNILHYRVSEVPLGAQVVAVLPSTPAWSAGVRCNDLITAVDGKRVLGAASFSEAVKDLAPGETVTLTDHRSGSKKAVQVRVRLAPPPRQLVEKGFANRGYLGLEVQDDDQLGLPFPVSIDAGGIGGPSAGLAFTLAILDTLSNGKLTGAHVVAATGTISPGGAVGEVGGVQEKTVAVEAAGAQVFFVPAAEYQEARAVASSHLDVVPVSTLGEVLRILQRRYGGELPARAGAK